MCHKVDPVVLVIPIAITTNPASWIIPVNQAVIIVIDAIPADFSRKLDIHIDEHCCIALALASGFASTIQALLGTVGNLALAFLIGKRTHPCPAWRAPEVAVPVDMVQVGRGTPRGYDVHVGCRIDRGVIPCRVGELTWEPGIGIDESRLSKGHKRASLVVDVVREVSAAGNECVILGVVDAVDLDISQVLESAGDVDELVLAEVDKKDLLGIVHVGHRLGGTREDEPALEGGKGRIAVDSDS